MKADSAKRPFLQILVFLLAGIVVVFITISAFHFVRSVRAAHQADMQLRTRYAGDLEVVRFPLFTHSTKPLSEHLMGQSLEGYCLSITLKILETAKINWAEALSLICFKIRF